MAGISATAWKAASCRVDSSGYLQDYSSSVKAERLQVYRMDLAWPGQRTGQHGYKNPAWPGFASIEF